PVGVTERSGGKIRPGRPDDGKVRQGIAADDLERVVRPVDERRRSAGSTRNDMGRGQEEAVGREGHPGAGPATPPIGAPNPKAGDRWDEPLGGRADGERVGVEKIIVAVGVDRGRPDRLVLSNHGWLCLPRDARLATDRHGPLVRPADDLDLERHRRRPQDPGASGAVCSRLPPIRRPPGPRNERSTALTVPKVTRGPPAGVAAAANTTEPIAGPSPSAHVSAGAPAVSIAITARSPSTSMPASRPAAERPSENVTVTSSPRTLWAFVRIWPSATTTPDLRSREPMPTTDGAIEPARRVMDWE